MAVTEGDRRLPETRLRPQPILRSASADKTREGAVLETPQFQVRVRIYGNLQQENWGFESV